MPHYQNSVIYKLKHNEDYDDTNIYVGSTSNFKHRKNQHKTSCNNEKNKKYNTPIYQYIRDNGGWDNWVMIPIEQYSCNSKKELEIQERHHIDLLRPKLNIIKPGRTKKEYYEDHKEVLNEKFKEYYEVNKKKILEQKKEHYENNKDKINKKTKEYYQNNKEKLNEKTKEYYQNNKEKLNKYTKQWYEDNKEKLKEKIKEKAICDHCGSEIRKQGLNIHKKSKKCINFVKS
jgi:RNA polymerase-binding transcription factor DksA